MNFRSVSIRTLLLLPAALFVLSACTDEKLVEVPVDRPPFNPPADSVNGFLGLYDVATNQTTCGNCHVNNQGEWAQTAHADAFATLENSGGAQSFCYSCHTVSANGNMRRPRRRAGGLGRAPLSDVATGTCSARAATARASRT